MHKITVCMELEFPIPVVVVFPLSTVATNMASDQPRDATTALSQESRSSLAKEYDLLFPLNTLSKPVY